MMSRTKATDSKVKSFAQRLVKDHSAANAKMEEIARKNNVSVSEAASSSAGDSKTGKERTSANTCKNAKTSTPTSAHPEDSEPSGLQGTEFDKAFVKKMIENTKQALRNLSPSARGHEPRPEEIRVFDATDSAGTSQTSAGCR